jgi:hypothetical protein
MSLTLSPREVEKPFGVRWLRMTWQLVLRSPMRFSVVILILGGVDTVVVHLLEEARATRTLLTNLGMGALAVGVGLVALNSAVWLLFSGAGKRDYQMLPGRMLVVAGVLQAFVPAYGMTMAAWLVFAGVLNYVAYRDIFERRSSPLPTPAEAEVASPVILPARP